MELNWHFNFSFEKEWFVNNAHFVNRVTSARIYTHTHTNH